MESSIQLAKRFREVILNGKWIANTNLKDQLQDVTLEQAVAQVFHLNTFNLQKWSMDPASVLKNF